MRLLIRDTAGASNLLDHIGRLIVELHRISDPRTADHLKDSVDFLHDVFGCLVSKVGIEVQHHMVASIRLQAAQNIQHGKRKRPHQWLEVLVAATLWFLSLVARYRHGIQIGKDAIQPPRHVRMHFKVTSPFLVGSHSKRATVPRLPLSRVVPSMRQCGI